METHFNQAGWSCHLYGVDEAAPLVVMPVISGDGREVLAACRKETRLPFHLLVLHHEGWNDLYSPWPMPSPFEQEGRFLGQGAETLRVIRACLLPEAEARLQASVTERALVGYSMAGLFALYGALEADVFGWGASVSGSLWALGLGDYLEKAVGATTLRRFYVSLGNKERKSRNPLLAPLAAESEKAVATLEACGIETTFVINPGNHFTEPEQRVARAVAWLLNVQ